MNMTAGSNKREDINKHARDLKDQAPLAHAIHNGAEVVVEEDDLGKTPSKHTSLNTI